ncbi:LuxR family transcriptional regulator [Corallococcus terminator]|uniref:LuxR family transcriptional regulator n=2 Tax=Corallococcus terminator TaxID=2316733 RepID=A0A3A8INE9_9BACT|nr:LuxR family transcriptional regulator [Corallococcus terminator]
METPLRPGSHVLLVIPEPGAASIPGARGLAMTGELIIGGQRYHLVPAAEPEPASDPRPAAAVQLLTARELQVVSCICEGLGNKQIAAKLGISTWTVAAHLRRIFAKLGVDTRAAVVSRCFGAPSVPPLP